MRYVLLLIALATAAGCRSLSPAATALDAVRRAYPEARPTLETSMNLGLFTRGLALSVLAMGDRRDEDTQTVRRLVRTMRSAQIRRYRLAGLDSATLAARPFRFAPSGWEPIVRVRSGGERFWMLGRPSTQGRDGTVLVGMLEPESLTLVQVNGRYERMLEAVEQAMADDR